MSPSIPCIKKHALFDADSIHPFYRICLIVCLYDYHHYLFRYVHLSLSISIIFPMDSIRILYYIILLSTSWAYRFVPVLELWDDRNEENIRKPIFYMNELSLNVLFPTYETSDTVRVIIKAHIGVCGSLRSSVQSEVVKKQKTRCSWWVKTNSRCIQEYLCTFYFID